MSELTSYVTPIGESRFEPPATKGSRSVATVAHVADESEASAFIDRVRAEFSNATHTCYAWVLGEDGKHTRANDDGEPAGSAGRPILAQLEGHAVTFAAVCVTRWFGGTKLGVGGLVRAYGGAAGQALDRAPLERRALTRRVRLEFPYECTSAVQAILHAAGLAAAEAEYGVRVLLVLDVPRHTAAALEAELRERTGGRVAIG